MVFMEGMKAEIPGEEGKVVFIEGMKAQIPGVKGKSGVHGVDES